jgi:hypothetical protein
MLAGVLLHVIEAAPPLDLAGDARGVQWRLENVGDAFTFIDDVGETHTIQVPEVMRLSSGRWIECCTIEIHPTPLVRNLDDLRLEGRQVGIRVVQARCAHWRALNVVVKYVAPTSNLVPGMILKRICRREYGNR